MAMFPCTRTALLVATALGVSTPVALAQDSGQSGGSAERFGQMKTPEGHQQAGDVHMSGGGNDTTSGWRGGDQDHTSSIDDEDDDDNDDGGQGQSYRQSASHDGHDWDRGRGDRWRGGSRDDEREFWRQHARQEWRNRMRDRMQSQGMGSGRMGMMGARGAVFNVQVGDARLTVRCGAREEMSACVDAAVSLVNRLRQGASGSSSGSSSQSSGSQGAGSQGSGGPTTAPSSSNPAPAPSTSKPTTP